MLQKAIAQPWWKSILSQNPSNILWIWGGGFQVQSMIKKHVLIFKKFTVWLVNWLIAIWMIVDMSMKGLILIAISCVALIYTPISHPPNIIHTLIRNQTLSCSHLFSLMWLHNQFSAQIIPGQLWVYQLTKPVGPKSWANIPTRQSWVSFSQPLPLNVVTSNNWWLTCVWAVNWNNKCGSYQVNCEFISSLGL